MEDSGYKIDRRLRIALRLSIAALVITLIDILMSIL